MDRGPWSVQCTHAYADVYSHDFEHDVSLRITGDFADDDERRVYAEWLAGVLNRATVQPSVTSSE